VFASRSYVAVLTCDVRFSKRALVGVCHVGLAAITNSMSYVNAKNFMSGAITHSTCFLNVCVMWTHA